MRRPRPSSRSASSAAPAPPVLFLALLFLQMLVAAARPGPRMPPGVTIPVALTFMVAGGWLHVAAERAFARAGTTRATLARPDTLVTTGPYAFSRNPMYVGGALFLVGVAVGMSAALALLVVPVYVIAVAHLYVFPEERLLERELGEEWRAYAGRVRRWL